MLSERLMAIHMAVLSSTNITSLIDSLLASTFGIPSAVGVKTDPQPDSFVSPNPYPADETAIRIDNKQFWLEPGLAQYGNGPLNSWLFVITSPSSTDTVAENAAKTRDRALRTVRYRFETLRTTLHREMDCPTRRLREPDRVSKI